MLFLIIMAVCLIYFILIVLYAGLASSFSWFWLLAGLLSGAMHVIGRLIRKGKWFSQPQLWMRVGFWTTIGVGVFIAVVIETLVVIGMFSRPEASEVDYLIVLGAHINGDTPTRSLRYRLDKAIEYLEKDEDIIVIVSGGQGTGETVTEAYAMARYLISHGVAPERILMESASTNTHENLVFSYAMIEDPDATVGIITNSFHVYRASRLAAKLGMKGAVGIAAPSDKLLLPSYMVRELFAVIKEKIMGYI